MSLAVVITTHNRPDGVRRAVHSVQSVDTGMDTTIVIVDDGSRPDVATDLDLLAGPGVVVVHQDDLGLGVARRHGVALTDSHWLTFLDDDDEWLPGWSELAALIADEPVDTELAAGALAVASGASSLWTSDGEYLRDELPRDRGPLYSGLDVQFVAGCWVVRRDLYDLAGGYLAGLSASHQSELFFRIGSIVAEQCLSVALTDTPVTRIECRDNAQRSLSNPKVLYDGLRWVLARHRAAFERDPLEFANWHGWAATNGIMVGASDAPSLAVEAVRAEPSIRRAGRAAAMLTPIGRRLWSAPQMLSGSASNRAPLEHAAELALLAADPTRAVDATESAGQAPVAVPGLDDVDVLFLPWRYRENPQASSDAGGTPFWGEPSVNDIRMQAPVYRLVARRLRHRADTVLDIGCGSGDKLVHYLAPVARRWWGVDQPSAITEAGRRWGDGAPNGAWCPGDLSSPELWDELYSFRPDLVMCVDVIEHLDDPHELLARLRRFSLQGADVIVSTPDRSHLDGSNALGPPLNPRHVREWSEPEFRLLVESAGFHVDWVRHLLPRTYSASVLELKRSVHRVLHRRWAPDRRSCMVFSLSVNAADSGDGVPAVGRS